MTPKLQAERRKKFRMLRDKQKQESEKAALLRDYPIEFRIRYVPYAGYPERGLYSGTVILLESYQKAWTGFDLGTVDANFDTPEATERAMIKWCKDHLASLQFACFPGPHPGRY